MELKIVETSLNLRVEKRLGKCNMDYVLSSYVAREQLKLGADVYCNVEYMECQDKMYMEEFEKAGYTAYKGLDSCNQRGILYMVKNEYPVRVIEVFDKPHMMHIQVEKGGTLVDLITVRILVSDGKDADYFNRKVQWERIENYIRKLKNTDNLCITGDFNHGVISEKYRENQARRLFNYQMIVTSLKENDITLAPVEGMSYKGYMKIDHIGTSKDVVVLEAKYLDLFCDHRSMIGVPDHSMIEARLKFD